jgi:glucuronate isomerase
MNDTYISENFLLQTYQAVSLYHEFAKDLPIVDYHCHLPTQQVANDHRFTNLTQIWLAGDHYKWRAMRAAGVAERFITGDADDWEKFQKWAETIPQTLRNPLYHWSHLELARPFGIRDRLLNPSTAREVYDQCNEILTRDDFSCRGIMRQMNVVVVCTTDDPLDSLEHHEAIAADTTFPIKVLPTFRPDKAMNVGSPADFNVYVDRLAEVTGIDIGHSFERHLEAIAARHDHFHARGCRLSDHGLESFPAEEYARDEIQGAFAKLRRGDPLGEGETQKLQSAMLHEFALMDHAKGWTQQFHVGAMRNNNTRMFRAVGPDAGFDSIGDPQIARPMSRFLDRLDQDDRLAKTILYNLNPCHNHVMATMIGNFQDGQTPGKMQFGSGWWFLDQKDGMEKQIDVLSNQGLLSRFVGMLTDSRSFLSYTRHEYFRRILCNKLGVEMAQGLLPNDLPLVGRLVQDVCYFNAANYFGFELPPVERHPATV